MKTPSPCTEPLTVTFFQRKPGPGGSPSIEVVFDNVRRYLGPTIESRVSVASVLGTGLLRRLWVCAEAAFRQGDVNHVTGDISWVGLALRPERTIQTVHDCYFLTQSSGIRRALLRHFWLVLPLRRCVAVTTVSEATRQELLRFVPECDAEKIRVIPSTFSDRFVPVVKPFDHARPRILQIGTGPNKNVARLIEALRGIPCQLDVIGKRNSAIETLAEGAGLSVSWRSGLTDDEVLVAYRDADLVAFVSTYEGFGLPIVEAQATGRAVLTSNTSSMPFVAGRGAHFVDPFDVNSIRSGLRRLISDDTYREELIRIGFENAARYHPAGVAAKYRALYEEVARAAGRGSRR
jgi:glycosyltransferase involved in cell wall biosynthesis